MPKPTKPKTPQEKAQLIKPYIAQPCPYNIRLQAGKQYYYCTCGLTSSQPFCDGVQCQGTKFVALKFLGKKQTLSSICGCRRNDKDAGPYCDGNHNDINW